MTLPAGTIDLGELPPGGQPEFEPPWPGVVRLRRWRWRDRRPAARLAGAATVTALLLTLAAAAGPLRPAFLPLLSLAIHGYGYDQEQLYVVEAPGTGTLAAYSLADGGLRWRAPLPDPAKFYSFHRDRVLLVSALSHGRASTAFDPATGRRLWRSDPGELFAVAGGWFVFAQVSFGGRPREIPRLRFSAVDQTTGRPGWSVSAVGEDYHHGSSYLVIIDREGRLTSYRLATGERSASVAIPHAEFSAVRMVGSLALVLDRSGQPPVLTGYDLATLTRRWSATLARNHLPVLPEPCGRLVCLASPRFPRALDPVTGETVWSADWLPADDRRDHYFMVSNLDLPGGRLLLSDVSRAPDSRASWLVEATTGEPVLDLAGWRPGPGGPPGAGPGGGLLVRTDGPTTLVGRLHPDLSGVQPLGVIEGTTRATECQPLPGLVVCTTWPPAGDGPGELTLWRSR
jgi:outer membrane protein assembly factor BamB